MSATFRLLNGLKLANLIERVGGPNPTERLAALRLVLGGFALGYLLLRGPHLLGYAGFSPDRFSPVGVVSLLPAPVSPWVHYLLYLAAVVSGFAFVLGVRFRLVAPVFAALVLWLTSYRNSWGMIFHTENLMVLHLVLLSLFPAADAWSLDARRPARQKHSAPNHAWGVLSLSLITTLTYLVAGVAKLHNTGIEWALGDVLRAQVAYDNLRKLELGSFHSPLGVALVPYAWLFPPLGVMSLAIELFSPLCLLGQRSSRVWAVCAWGFHAGVLLLMAVIFFYPLFGVAYASFFPVERLPKLRRVGEWLAGSR